MYSQLLEEFFNDKFNSKTLETNATWEESIQLQPTLDLTTINENPNALYTCNHNGTFLMFGFCVCIYSPVLKRAVGLNYVRGSSSALYLEIMVVFIYLLFVNYGVIVMFLNLEMFSSVDLQQFSFSWYSFPTPMNY